MVEAVLPQTGFISKQLPTLTALVAPATPSTLHWAVHAQKVAILVSGVTHGGRAVSQDWPHSLIPTPSRSNTNTTIHHITHCSLY